MVFEKSLTAMVKGIRAHRGKESEYINSCLQEIQKEVASNNLQVKSVAVLKLAYLTMFGYDMSWATFAVVEVMSHSKYAIKRPGYLASAMSFNDSTDVGVLTINLFKKDFGSKSQYESGMAIGCLSSICTPQISRDILTDLSAMLSSSRAYLRKKTVLCLYRVFLKDPPALRTCFPKLKERLGDEDQGVLTASVNTFLELARKNARNYLSLVPQLYHILVNTTNNWLSIKLLKLFQLLCPLEPRLPPKMVEPLNNLLNVTKAASVEFEAIRTALRVLPEGTALVDLAVEKLQVFLNSSDRNLRYISLELFQESLEKTSFRERYTIPDLHSKVLQCIEETDPTARMIALRLLDLIVTPASFVDSVKKLMEFSKKSLSADEFHQTILRMGVRDRYVLVEDFAWYLLVLADISRSLDSEHADEVAEQFTDIVVRVAGVRPYAVQLAMSLLDRDPAAVTATQPDDEDVGPAPAFVEVAPAMLGACAWVVGEFHKSFDEDVKASLLKATKALLAKGTQSMEPTVQTRCIWSALKMTLGATEVAPSIATELREFLLTSLPAFAVSTHVDVSERATMALGMLSHMQDSAPGSAVDGLALFAEPLLPVAVGSQQAVAVPEDLLLDEPFFPEEEAPAASFAPVRSDPADPYALAASYKDDLGLLAAQEPGPSVSSTTPAQGQSSLYYLGSSKEQGSAGAPDTTEARRAARVSGPLDPLEQMRQKLAASRAGGAAKYEVMREEVRAPPAASASAAPARGPTSSVGAVTLSVPTDKEVTELQGRLWFACYSDDNIRLYCCVRAKSVKKQNLRLELRCERIPSAGPDAPVVGDVQLRFPAGVVAQEAVQGVLSLVAGALTERSPKVRATLGLGPFVLPATIALGADLLYNITPAGGAPQQTALPVQFRLPSTTFLIPAAMSEDDIATYMAEHAAKLLTQQVGEAVSLQMPGKSAAEAAQAVPLIVGRCSGLCHFHCLQQQAPVQGGSQKFLMVARPPPPPEQASPLPGQEALPRDSLVVCMCAVAPKDGGLELKVTVKTCREDVCKDVCAQLVSIFRELVEGRLCSAA